LAFQFAQHAGNVDVRLDLYRIRPCPLGPYKPKS
jgi:hypothetical protein